MSAPIRLPIPDGQVDAFCGVCKRDVVIPEDTLRCPNGEHDVEPSSLPRVPKQTASVAPTTVTLPGIKQATAWGQATEDLLAALEEEEASALRDFESARERVKVARRAANALRQMRDVVRVGGGSAPDGKRWAKKFDRCVDCGTTERKHLSRGRCTRCYSASGKPEAAS